MCGGGAFGRTIWDHMQEQLGPSVRTSMLDNPE